MKYMKEVFTAATIEEAKALAAESFGVSIDKITFKVLEEVKKGLFRKPQARVQAEYEYPVVASMEKDVPPIKVMVTEDDRKASIAAKKEEEKPAPAPAPVPVEVKPEPVAETEKTVIEAAEVYDEEAPAEPAKPIDPKAYAAKTEAAVNYIVSILEKMGLENVSAVPTEADGGIIIELSADGLSDIIGKKGELLDSLQYLSSLVCNRIDREYFRITTDSCGFRARRKAQLERLAHKLATGVKKSGRTHSLEPMNPYERRIIHAAVSEVEGVTSKSVGEEPYRKVVISSTEKKPRGDFKGGKGGRRGGGRGHGKPKPHYDITTSFEKNYKKPKPEDDMDLGSGVYGKIDF